MFRCLHLYFLWDQEKPSLLISHRNRLFSYFFRNDCAFFIDAKCKCSGCNPIPGAGSSELCDYRPAFSSWKAELLLVSNCIFFLIISFIKGTKLTAQAIFTIAEKQSIRYTREKIKQGKNGFWLKKITTKLAVALGCFFLTLSSPNISSNSSINLHTASEHRMRYAHQLLPDTGAPNLFLYNNSDYFLHRTFFFFLTQN